MRPVEILRDEFINLYQHQPEVVSYAPGRVNLIGDHTDYNDGFVLPVAINYGTHVVASKRRDKQVFVHSLDMDCNIQRFSLDSIEFNHELTWVNYISGTLKMLMTHYHFDGVNMLVSGNIPQGAGLSSSASLEISVLKTIATLFDLPLDGVTAALLGQKAENQFVGCNCGIMDQLISSMGMAGKAMLLDCRSLQCDYASFPENTTLLIVNSNVKRGLVDSEYNLRREQCETVARTFNQQALRDVSLDHLSSNKDKLSDVLYRRARHVITENQRTIMASDALRDTDMNQLSRLMRESHQSLKHDFETSTPEIDYLVEIISEIVGDEGGARMTGGGFGGCVVVLSQAKHLPAIKEALEENYQARTGLIADLYLCDARDGAFI